MQSLYFRYFCGWFVEKERPIFVLDYVMSLPGMLLIS
jgi:hypothetical protein